MCDTIVVAHAGGGWLAKNSDREPGEAQAVEHVPGGTNTRGRRQCTHVTIDVPRVRHAIVIGRPVWMWGAEMGINAHGVAIGNEAVFTREPVASRGLTGMDLLRLALEHADSADAALAFITDMLQRHPQGGRMSHRGRMRYHSAFAIADRNGAWILETAGRFWAARRVVGIATISNALSIGSDYDAIHPEAADHARRRGFCKRGAVLDFAAAFSDPLLAIATGAAIRRACTAATLPRDPTTLRAEDFAAALSDHGDRHPAAGWRMQMPCAHASWWPTRRAGQTTGSFIAALHDRPRAWLTGTSAPCLSVFKPVDLHDDVQRGEPVVRERLDAESLWWRHERLHRLVLRDYAARRNAIAEHLALLRARAWSADNPQAARAIWTAHRMAMTMLAAEARAAGQPRRRDAFALFWSRQERADMPR